jgi:hypothetical protein
MISYRMTAALITRLSAAPLYIGGRRQEASGAPIAVIDPAREEPLGDVRSATATGRSTWGRS